MARSIHTTRRQLDELHQDQFADAARQREDVCVVRADLARKRLTKAQVLHERRRDDAALPPLDPTTIPIRIFDQSDHVHHAASPADLRAVMARLPPGILDGLSAIVLGLGMAEQARRPGEDGDPDPFTGRRGHEVLAGVHAGRVLGLCRSHPATIHVFAYVHPPDLAERRVKQLVLKLHALTTFVHEVAHHHDFTARIARGRWLADDSDQREAYAEHMELTLLHDVVLPYLEVACADDVTYFGDWTERHGGVRVPLALLVDPRPTRAGTVPAERWLFSTHAALETLLEDVAAGRDPLETRVELARQIHYGGEYAMPRTILAGVLAEHPGHMAALILEADIDVHQGAPARAEAICRDVLARDPACADAWEVLVDALHDQQRWAALVDAVARARRFAVSPMTRLLRLRARAHFELGNDPELAADLAGLGLGRPHQRRFASGLHAAWLLRHDRLDEALALVAPLFEDDYPPGVEARAVRFEAAHRLGRPGDAGQLTAEHLATLRRAGHVAWADRLLATHADHIATPLPD